MPNKQKMMKQVQAVFIALPTRSGRSSGPLTPLCNNAKPSTEPCPCGLVLPRAKESVVILDDVSYCGENCRALARRKKATMPLVGVASSHR